MGKVPKKILKKEQKFDILNQNLNFKNLNFSKILAMSFISILIISLGVSIFYEFKEGKGIGSNDADSQISSAIEYDCNYVWFQQIVNKATREVIWVCNSARPYCKAGTSQCCKWTNETGHYDCYDMKSQQVAQDNDNGGGGGNTNPNPNNLGCLDSDNGKEIWIKGNCNGNYDYCTQNFGKDLHEYYCANNNCTQETIDCTNHGARCYNGKCVRTDQDTDGDGFSDLDEYEAGTNPNDPTSNPNTVSQEANCSSICTNAGYNGGRGPVISLDYCVPPMEVFYTDNYNTSCCCNLEWYCCTKDSDYNCFPGSDAQYCPTGWNVLPLGPYAQSSTCSENCHAAQPPPIQEYDCNYTWYQQIVNKSNLLQVLWTCNINRPFCKAGTPQCCKWTEATGHYDCYDMLLNQIVPVITVFCTDMCDTFGFKSGRSVPDLNQCTVSESKKQQGDQYCCCSGPPESLPECQAAALNFGATAGLYPVATWDDCYAQTLAYCTSIGKEPAIWALVDLSHCCFATCGGPPA